MYIFIISGSVLLRRNISGKNCRENQNTHFMFSNFFPRQSCRLWDNVQHFFYSRAGHRWLWHMRIARL